LHDPCVGYDDPHAVVEIRHVGGGPSPTVTGANISLREADESSVPRPSALDHRTRSHTFELIGPDVQDGLQYVDS
jgi:hypothetical protein